MHPTTEDLLRLLDGEPAGARLAARLDDPNVRGELARLAAVRRELRALPEMPPPAGVWDKVLAEAAAAAPSVAARPARRSWHWPARLALAASVAVLAVLLIQRAVDRPPGAAGPALTTVAPKATAGRQGTPLVRPSYASLAAESQRLERLLSQLDYQPRVTSAGTASIIAELEDRIALVDYQLATVGPGLTGGQRVALWQQRVDLMNSLVKVRYAHAGAEQF